jgi:hypothetical protein
MYSREQLLQIQSSARIFQARADDALAPWGIRAPQLVAGEDPDHYRRRLLIQAKYQLPEDHEYRGVGIKKLPADALKPYEDLIYSACKDAASRADSVPVGQMRRVEEVDANTGRKIVNWIGQQSFVRDFAAPVRYVVGFRTPQGFMNTSGRYIR